MSSADGRAIINSL